MTSSSSSSSSLLRKDVLFRLPPTLFQYEEQDDGVYIDHIGTTLSSLNDDDEENENEQELKDGAKTNSSSSSLQELYRLRTCRRETDETTTTHICNSSQLQEHIQTLIEEYQEKFYSKKKKHVVNARCLCQQQQDDEQHFVVYTYVEYNDRNNCACGTWSATWNIDMVDEKSCELHGRIQFHAYNYENTNTSGSAASGDNNTANNTNNIQTRVQRKYEKRTVSVQEEHVHSLVAQFEKTQMSYGQQLSKAIVDNHILRHELDFYNDTKTMYQDNVRMRPLRGILPLTKTKFKWDVIATQKNAMLLNNTARKSV